MTGNGPCQSGKFQRLQLTIASRYGGRMKSQPQQLSREAIDEFKAIYQEEFGEMLSDDEVQEIAMQLLRFFGILTKETPDSVDASNPAR